MQYFEASHLPPPLKLVSLPFCELAYKMDQMLLDGPEKSVALRKLLEAKDAAVRASLPPRAAVLDTQLKDELLARDANGSEVP